MEDTLFVARRCSLCDEVKPARTHHCSQCGECVFVMDHLCPWVNNCVGLENKRYFILFTTYLLVGTLYMLLTFGAIRHYHDYQVKH